MKEFAVVILTLLACLSLTPHEIQGQGEEKASPLLPGGSWSVSFGPYEGPGSESAPVRVASLGGTVLRKSAVLGVRELTIRNRSEKTVARVELTFFVYEGHEPNKVLIRQQWVTIAHPGGQLPAGGEFRYRRGFMGAGFTNHDGALFTPLVKDGKLEGSFRIALGVSKVYFEDGSVWEM